MRTACWMLFGLSSFLTLTSAGCSSGEDISGGSSNNAGETPAQSAETDSGATSGKPSQPIRPKVKTVELKSLAPTKGLSPSLDESRIQVPLLKDWFVPPRSSQWLFRFQRDKKTAYPQIFVRVDGDAPAEVESLTKKNVAEFAAHWQQQLDKTHDPNSFGEEATPVQLGERYAVECLIYVASDESKQEQMLLKLIENNRIYTLELRALRGTLEGYRSSLYAVAAGLKPVSPTSGSDSQGFGGFGSGNLDSPDEAELEKTLPE